VARRPSVRPIDFRPVELLGVLGWPVLDRIHLGPLAISPHGVGIAAGYLLGARWMLREGPKRGVQEDHVGTLLLAALLGAIVGARFFYVLGHFDEFDGITDMLAVWRGGISLIGGILGGIIAAYPFMRRYGYRFAQVMDSAAVGLAFGIGFGRIGDLVIGDHLGKPTDFLLGFQYSGGTLPGPWQQVFEGTWRVALPGGKVQLLSEQGAQLCEGECGPGAVLQSGPAVHQTALYDMGIALALFGFLWWLNRKPRREGTLIAVFAIWYGAGRVLTDFLRVDKTWVIGLTGSQWASLGAIVLGIAALVWFKLRPAPVTTDAVPAGAVPTDDVPTTTFTPPPEPGSGPPDATSS
jgi:phosphatidylglycerol---prolipoprotein diacylglyceryl transferase